MDECNTVKKERTTTIQDDIKEVQERIECHLSNRDLEEEWAAYSSEAPSVEEFNSPCFGKEPIEDVEPEVFTLSGPLTPETKQRILQEFLESAKIAQVKPIEGHPCMEGSYGDNPMCPILNNPDEILVKIQEVFHSGETVMEEEDGTSDKHFILGYIQSKFPKRKLGWREGSLYVDGARTNVTYQWISEKIARQLRKVFN